MLRWVILFAGIGCNAAASVLVKVAMSQGSAVAGDGFARYIALAMRPSLVLGVLLYGGAFVLYAAALTRFPLNVAHPILTSGAIAAVALCSYFVFGERFYWNTVVGLALVVVGVWLIAVRA